MEKCFRASGEDALFVWRLRAFAPLAGRERLRLLLKLGSLTSES